MNEAEIAQIKEFFVREFTWIMIEVNNLHSYLGIQISLHEGIATMDMSNGQV